VCRKKPSRLA